MAKQTAKATPKIYQLRAELCEYEPAIWRTFQVPSDIKMSRFAYVLMTLFEMQASHEFSLGFFHDFNVRRRAEPEWEPEDGELIMAQEYELDMGNTIMVGGGKPPKSAKRYALSHEFEAPGDEMCFLYDFGDNWQVFVSLEEVIEPSDLSGEALPRVLEGEGWGILENCGGVEGLADAARILKEKKGEEYEDLCEWLETRDRDLEAFDIDDMNFRLQKVPAIYEKIYEKHQGPSKQAMDILTRQYQNAGKDDKKEKKAPAKGRGRQAKS